MDRAVAVAGLGWGDEGKGGVVDFLTAHFSAGLVVRYNGGAQAAHHVTAPDGRTHCFSQWGSGTFVGARTHLSKFMVIEPLAMQAEAHGLMQRGIEAPFERLTCDPWALVATPYHRAFNRMQERARGDRRHGSCGMGIGDATADRLAGHISVVASDLKDPALLHWKLEQIWAVKCVQAERLGAPSDGLEQSPDQWMPAMRSCAGLLTLRDDQIVLGSTPGTVIFEGAQGVLLDEHHGFHPHTTWSTTTFHHAETLVDGRCPIEKIGVTRLYGTRHGAGPFPTEDVKLRPGGVEHNGAGAWQGAFRLGHLDLVLLRYAIAVCGGIDGLAVTSLDRLPTYQAALRYDFGDLSHALVKQLFPDAGTVGLGPRHDTKYHQTLGDALRIVQPVYSPAWSASDIASRLEREAPIWVSSYGPTRRDKAWIASPAAVASARA